MKKSRFTEEQIIKASHEWEAGAKPGELCRRLGVTPPRVGFSLGAPQQQSEAHCSALRLRLPKRTPSCQPNYDAKSPRQWR